MQLLSNSESKKLPKSAIYTWFVTLTNVGRSSKFFNCCILPRNLQQNPCHIAHHTLDVSLHYLAKYARNWRNYLLDVHTHSINKRDTQNNIRIIGVNIDRQ